MAATTTGSEPKKLKFFFTPSGFTMDLKEDEHYDKGLEKWISRFEKDRYQAVYDLGFEEKPGWLDQTGQFLYMIADAFQKCLTRQTDLELKRDKLDITLDDDTFERLLLSVPFTPGSEYVNEQWLDSFIKKLLGIYTTEIKKYDGSVALYLADKSQHLKVPERIFFHLVENTEPDMPFAFLATYATKLRGGKIKHMPLQYALTEFKGYRDKLLELLSCLNKAADVSELIGGFVRSGEMFHPLRLTSDEAYRFLKDVPAIEKAGIVCRIPNWWKKNSASLSMSVKLGDTRPSMFSMDSLVSMCPQLMVDGVPLTQNDIRELLGQTDGLAYLKGKWVAVNHERLEELLATMENYQGELTLMQALRMNLGSSESEDDPDVGPIVTNGKWLSKLLSDMRTPANIKTSSVPATFKATLRPYQKNGFTWLNYMNKLGFGACLADDMGLGKTVQMLAFLDKMRKDNKNSKVLLVVPASLIGNWMKEAEKFTPSMSVCVLHGQAGGGMNNEPGKDAFLTITTYGMTIRHPELEKITWDCLVLDEAQAIKNPVSKQTRQIKKLHTRMKIAMTGTPIENDLTNLWSLFDFLNKGLLGSSEEFRKYCKSLEDKPEGYAKLKSMISPFMLRRVKTDKSIISDLPDKCEQGEYVDFSKKQVVLYKKYVTELEKKLNQKENGIKAMSDMERRGLVLSSIIRLKQICNHPDQYMGQSAYEEKDSGKFAMLREICETIYEKRERVLVFTQFTEVIPHLDDFLAKIFHKRGLVLHGGTTVKARGRLVEEFQGEDYIPYMILSVKAGGTGLTLTKASHVIHFDRWWNPAVENQATDRAYRIGQKNNVMVHKLVCKGTIEEKIDKLIESKKDLAENIIGSGGESWITEMSNAELLNIMRLE